MANLFDILKTYRPRRVIQSDDFNDLNAAVKASFQKLGDAPAAGEKGVSTPFTVGTPTLSNHAVPKSVMDTAETGVLANKNATDAAAAAALASQNAAATSEANSATSATDSAASAVTSGAAQVAAETAKTGAETAQAAALVSANAASASETNSAGSETNALASQNAAAASQVAAAASAASAAADAGSIGTAVSDAQTAATAAEGHLDTFQDQYLGSVASDPTTDLDGDPLTSGTLAFLTSTNMLRVHNGSGWQDAGSAVNGTAARDTFLASSGQTTFATSSSFDVGYCDVFLNGIKLLRGTDFSDSSGSSIVLTAPAALNDVIDIVAYGTFTLLNAIGSTDGGFANSTYTTAQNIDGGNASG